MGFFFSDFLLINTDQDLSFLFFPSEMQNKYESFRPKVLLPNTNNFFGNDSLFVEKSGLLFSFTKEQTGFKVLRANGLRLT